MDKEALLRRLTELVDEALRTRLYGEITVEFRDGHPTFIQRHIQEKVDGNTNGSTRAKDTYR